MIKPGPGPGNYMPPDPSKYKEQAPSYSIKGSGGHDFMSKDLRNAPGPGQYNAGVDGVKGKAPAFTMGGRRGSGRFKGDAPGPGQYNAKSSFDHRGGVMGKRPEQKYNANDGPGPGSYGTKDTLGH